MLTLFIQVQVSVTLKELGLDKPTGYHNVNHIYPGAGICDLKGAGLDNPTGYPIVNPISPGAGVCDAGRDGPVQPYWMPHC
jgi:hypothetical protein